LGLDGGTFDVLDPLFEQGVMPHLQKLRQEGAWGTLLSTIPPFTVPAWTSFLTGKQPGKHGVVSFFRRERSAYHTQDTGHFVNARAIPGETLWDMLSAEGQRVGVVNVPMTYPPRPVEGYVITGMLTPPGAEDYVYPPELRERLGDYRVDLEGLRQEDRFAGEVATDPHRFLADVMAMTRQRGETCQRLLREEPVDVFMVVFTGTDRLTHEFWPQLAAGCPEDDPVGRALRAYFGVLDGIIGELLAFASEAHVVVMSDHGFGPAPERRVLVNRWLEEQGWLRRQPEEQAHGLRAATSALLARRPGLRRFLRGLLPRPLRARVRQAVREDVVAEVDWTRTQAYFTPLYGYTGGISLNLRGVKPQGVVEEVTAEGLRTLIMDALRQLVDPETKEPILREVYPREAVFQGPYVESFPEIVFTLAPAYNAHYTLRSEAIVESVPHRWRHGEHRQEGILFLHGPAVQAGALDQPAHIVDIVPTVLYLLGLAIPDDLDGRVIEPALEATYLQDHPRETRPARLEPSEPGIAPGTFAEDEEAAVEERLRGLGYL
jgi:predicted AlkP superfamily phosphohydrolase/phosphomutase